MRKSTAWFVLLLTTCYFLLRLTPLEREIHIPDSENVVNFSAHKTLSPLSVSSHEEGASVESVTPRAPEFSRVTFRSLIREADFMNRLATEALMQKLRSQNLKEVGLYFHQELKDIGAADPKARAQLVFAAQQLQADELLDFWKDLALRTTPRSDDEQDVMGLTELTVDAKVIHGEMSAAIRNIGLIAYRVDEARAVLEQVVLHPQPLSHPTFVREYTFYALKEADEGAVLRILKHLPGTDPLRLALKSHMATR